MVKFNSANKFLGYDYFFNGNVVHGNRIDGQVPTANIEVVTSLDIINKNGTIILSRLLSIRN